MDVDQTKTLRALNEMIRPAAHDRTCAPVTRGRLQGASGNGRREGGKMKIWRFPFSRGKIQAKAAARAEAKAAEADRLAREARANGAA